VLILGTFVEADFAIDDCEMMSKDVIKENIMAVSFMH
jgi:hypothetical protein